MGSFRAFHERPSSGTPRGWVSPQAGAARRPPRTTAVVTAWADAPRASVGTRAVAIWPGMGAGLPVTAGALVIAVVVALLALTGTSSTPRSPAPAKASAVLVDDVGTTGTVNLGGITAGLDHTDVSIDLTAPDGPRIDPDVALGVEPGSMVDGLVPLVRGLMNGTGQVALHTPTIGSIKSIGVNLGVDGRITATVHQYEGLLSTPAHGG